MATSSDWGQSAMSRVAKVGKYEKIHYLQRLKSSIENFKIL